MEREETKESCGSMRFSHLRYHLLRHIKCTEHILYHYYSIFKSVHIIILNLQDSGVLADVQMDDKC